MLGIDGQKTNSQDEIYIEFVSKSCSIKDLHNVWRQDSQKKKDKLIEDIAGRQDLDNLVLNAEEKEVLAKEDHLNGIIENDDDNDEEEK